MRPRRSRIPTPASHIQLGYGTVRMELDLVLLVHVVWRPGFPNSFNS